jgi:hypothetical protein
MDASDWMPLPCVGAVVCSIGPDRPLGVTVDVGSSPSGVGVLLLSVAVGTEGDVGCVDGCTDEDGVCVLDTVSDAEGEVDGTHEHRGLGCGAG